MKNRKTTKATLARRRRRNRFRKLKTAALSVGLMTAWGGEAKADAYFDVEITPTVALTDAFVMYGNNVSSPAFVSLGDLPANVTSRTTHFFPSSDEFNGEPEFFVPELNVSPGYFIGAIYDEGGSPGVVLSFADDTPVTLAQEWADIFETSINAPFTDDFTEQEVSDAIQAGINAFNWPLDSTLASFQSDYGNPFFSALSPERQTLLTDYGQESTLVGFSTALDLGSATVTLLPEPTTFGLVGFGVTLAIAAFPERRM